MVRLQRFKRRGSAGEGTAVGGDVLTSPASGHAEPPPSAETEPEPDIERPPTATRLRLSAADSMPVTLFWASHPKQAVVTALGLAIAALVADRPLREAAVVTATALVGQAILGLHNDIVDYDRDVANGAQNKPIAQGRLDIGSAWYALAIAVLLVIPLSISTGVTAGTAYLGALVVGILGNVALRTGRFSWIPWAASFALYPAYLSYGGWGGGADGSAPEISMTVMAALLGIGVHFLRAIWGLVADDAEGWTYYPLRLGRRLGATRLLMLSTAYTGVVLVVMLILGTTVGLRQ